jgi:hypothetical protein
MSGAEEADGGAMQQEWSEEERNNDELSTKWIRSIILLASAELQDKAEGDLNRVLELKPDFVSGYKNRTPSHTAPSRELFRILITQFVQ